MPRPKRTRLAFLLLLAVGVAWLGWLAWRADTALLRRRLVRDIRALAHGVYPRAVQTPPVLPGRFGGWAADAWTALAALQGNSRDVEFCRAVREGEVAVHAAPESCLRELAMGEEALGRLLQATHAEAAGPPLGLGPLDVPAPKEDVRTFVTAGYAARMAALRLRLELGARRGGGGAVHLPGRPWPCAGHRLGDGARGQACGLSVWLPSPSARAPQPWTQRPYRPSARRDSRSRELQTGRRPSPRRCPSGVRPSARTSLPPT